jgi:predicted ATPase
VGKSSVLEVELISASAAGGLQSALSTAGGFYSLLTADDQTHMLRFGLQWPDPPGSPIDYELAIASGGILGGTQIS